MVQPRENKQHTDSVKHDVAYAVVSGLSMGVAFLHSFFWWGGILGLALYLVGLGRVAHRRRAFWYGTLAGTVKMLLVGSWLWYVYPLTWMGNFSAVSQLLGIGWMWLTWAVAVGASFGILAYVLYPYLEYRFRYYCVPVAYVSAEVIGSIFFSIVHFGAGSTINAHTSFGYLGYTIARHGILGDLAVVCGVYGLSLLAGVIAMYLADVLSRVRSSPSMSDAFFWRTLLIVTVFIGSYFVQLPLHGEPTNVRVATVNTYYENQYDMSISERAERVRLLIDAFREALASDSDIVVFPETSYALTVFGSTENIFSFIRSVTDRDVIVMDSDKQPYQDGGASVRAVLYDTQTEGAYPMYKNYLVPGGEYLPYHLAFFMSLLGFKDTSETLDSYLEFVSTNDEPRESEEILPGVLFCSESISPTEAFTVSRKATLPLILHPVSHAWLNEPTIFWYQLDLALRTQARFARVPIVQASNMADPYAFDALGNPLQGRAIYKTASTSVVVYDV